MFLCVILSVVTNSRGDTSFHCCYNFATGSLCLSTIPSAAYSILQGILFSSFQWGESSYSLLLSPTMVSCLVNLVFTGHEWTLALSKGDDQETDVQKREMIQGEKSDIMFLGVLQRLAIMCSSLYSYTRQIPGSPLNQRTKP